MQHYTHWIFDLDGTLTVPQHDFDGIRETLGLPRGVFILEYLETLDAATADPLREQLLAIEQDLARQAEAAPGAVELISALVERGCPLGIVTRNTRDNALAALTTIGLGGAFPRAHIVGRDEAPPKPAADGVLHLLQRWAGNHEAAVMVGDYRFDLEAGRNAGIRTAHIAGRDGPEWPEITDHRFYSLTEVFSAFSGA